MQPCRATRSGGLPPGLTVRVVLELGRGTAVDSAEERAGVVVGKPAAAGRIRCRRRIRNLRRGPCKAVDGRSRLRCPLAVVIPVIGGFETNGIGTCYD